MKRQFEELDYVETRLGALALQRRQVLALDGAEAFEVKLNGEYLMSSLFRAAEEDLARRGLGALAAGGGGWDVVVGGLGLGYTAAAALDYPRVARLAVVEALEPVIDWHRRGLVPNGKRLGEDPRCGYVHADFFALARGEGFDPEKPGRRWDAVLLDVDHTPTHHLSAAHADFYAEEGLRRVGRFLKPGGVFAMWSNDEPEEWFVERLRGAFAWAEGYVSEFDNPLLGEKTSNGIYVARMPGEAEG